MDSFQLEVEDEGRDREIDEILASLQTRSFLLAVLDNEEPRILHASDGFLELSGFKRDDLPLATVGLFGHNTSGESMAKIIEAMKQKKSLGLHLLSYKKDGSSFWNLIYISPLKLSLIHI
eukprot:TRINITY_DN12084_c0_g1_i1.p1 TRINITY_DN12084_c0_g1~~TRINITY_DN12084_c0_g1_i1.p1  ORF type:complete len:120 (-),score=25.71 TRINITY_DN12084_c0_g1_i1:33-392(-)